MSQSPETSEESSRQYAEGWNTLYRLAREGKSFSGRERHCAYLNLGDGSFANVASVSGIDLPEDGRALGVTDWDMDGALDMWISARSAPRLRLLRNTRVAKGDWVALSLRGTVSNRDAIGARVEVRLEGNERRFVRQLVAGDAFLSQSSKWLHIGLGTAARIESVEVRWPNGARESFSGIEAGGRFQLVEGSGQARALPDPPRVELMPSKLELPPSSGAGIVKLASSFPLLGFDYDDGGGQRQTLSGREGRHLLVNLWASWCPNCGQELAHWVRDAGRLREAGIDVLALSADKPEDRAQAARILEKLAWPFEQGVVDDVFLDRLDVLYGTLVTQPQDFVLPTSLLIDENGKLRALVRGQIEVAELLSLVEGEGRNPVEERQFASAADGRWLLPILPARISTFADRLQRSGHVELGARYMSRLRLVDSENRPEGAGKLMGASMASLGARLEAEGRLKEACEAFERCLEKQPERIDVLLELGSLRVQMGQVGDARRCFDRAVEVDPDASLAHYNLGLLELGEDDLDGALEEFLVTVRLDPQHIPVRYNLAVLFARRGQLDKASEWARSVLELQPNHSRARAVLAQILRMQNRISAAIAECRAGLQHDPQSIQLHFELGVELAVSGDFEGASLQREWLSSRASEKAEALATAIESMRQG